MSAYLRYQTPTDDILDGTHSQTVMYGRDVLNKKAGTCIDLAILYASACRAVGLEPLLVLPPGHCYPVIRLPAPLTFTLTTREGQKQVRTQYIGVEATMIGKAPFEAAWQQGTLVQFVEHKDRASTLIVDVCEEQARGVRPLPFPALSLKDIGISDDDARWAGLTPGGPPQGGQPQGGTPQGGRAPGNGGFVPQPTPEGERKPANPVGQWFASGRFPDGTAYEYTLTLAKDGTYKLVQKLLKMLPRGGAVPSQQTITGTYKVGQESIVFTTDGDEKQVCEYRLFGNRMLVSMPHLQYGKIHFSFVRLPD
jgi:hypothetical protein